MMPPTPQDTEYSSPRFCLAEVLSDHHRTLALLIAGDGTIADLNDSMARRLGKPAAELKGTLLWPHLPEEQRAACQATFLQVLREGQPNRQDVQYNGRWYDRRLTPCRNEHGEVVGLGEVAWDITERKLAEVTVRASEELLRKIADLTPDYIFVKDRQLRTVFCNEAVGRAVGKAPHELYGKTDLENGWDPDSIKGNAAKGIRGFERDDLQVLEGHVFRTEGEPVMVAGEVRAFDTVKLPLRDEAGAVVGLVGLSRDVTNHKQAQLAARESEERFAAMANAAPVLIWTSGPDKLCTHFNQPWLEFTGRTLEQELGNGWAEGVHPDDWARCLDLYVASFDARRPFRMEYRLRRHDGEYRWILDHGVPHYHPEGGFVGYIGSCIDVTERKAMEAELRFQAQILTHMHEGVNLVRVSDGTIAFTNDRYDALLGYAKGELLGRHVSVVNAPVGASPEAVAARIIQDLEQHGYWEGEVANRRKDGGVIWMRASVTAFDHPQHGKVWLGVSRDTTALRQTEAALRESHERYEELVRTIPSGICAFRACRDGRWRIDYASPRTAELLGVEGDAMLADFRATTHHAHPEDEARIWDAVRRAVEGQTDFECEARFIVGGETRWLHMEGCPTLQSNGDRVWNGTITDITPRKQAEENLRRSEQELRAVFEHASVGIGQADPHHGRILRANPSFAAMTGYSPAELTQVHISELTHPDDRQRDKELFQQVVRGETPNCQYEKRYVHKDGSLVWANVNMALIRDASGEPWRMVGVMENITARKQAEAALRESEQLFSKLFYRSPIPIVLSRMPDRMLVEANEEFLRLFGASREEIVGHTSAELGLWPNQDEHKENILRLRERGQVEQWEGHGRKRSGEVVNLLISADLVELHGQPHILGMLLDITERKRLEGRLRDAVKLEAVGHLAGGVAHQFNNILAGVIMTVELVPTASAEDGANLLQEVKEECQRAAELVRQLLAVGQRSMLSLRTLDLADLIQQQRPALRQLLGEDMELRLSAPSVLPLVSVDAAMIERILLDLCQNAKEAMKPGGRLTLRLDTVNAGSQQVEGHRAGRPGLHVRLAVSDTGRGMSEATLKRLFEPFFTTKEVGQGTGLGLATMQGVIEQHHGWVEVMSREGEGTTFWIYLPAVETAPNAAPVPTRTALVHGQGTILLVEDTPILRRVSSRLLSQVGYRVLEAADDTEALALWEAHRAEIDLLYTDVVLGGAMNGQQLAERLRQDKPGLQVILTTGYSDEVVERTRLDESGMIWLRKPCPPDTLTAVISQCLHGK